MTMPMLAKLVRELPVGGYLYEPKWDGFHCLAARDGHAVELRRMGRLPGAAARWSPDEMAHDWVPVAPVLVCEVAYDHVDALRFRHPARFRRWRPDRDP